MSLNGIDRLLWAAGLFGDVALLLVLVTRGRTRHFPWFTSLITLNVLRTLLLALIHSEGSEHAYLVAYLGCSFLDNLIQLGVVFELASHVFRPQGRWASDTRRSLLLLTGGSLVLAALLTWLAVPPASSFQFTLLVRSSFLSAALMTELFVGLVVLSVTVGLPWRTHVARIAQGLGVYSFVDVVLEAGHTVLGQASGAQMNHLLTHGRMVLYLLCLAYWGVTLWGEAPVPRALPAALRKQLRALEGQLAYDLYTIRKWRRQ